MKHYVIAGLLLFYGADALADSQAVQETTFQTGFASGDTYTSGGSDSSTYGINGGVTFPLAFYHHSWSLWLAIDHLIEGLPRSGHR